MRALPETLSIHRKLITRNTGSRHAHRDGGVELAAHGIENGRAEGVVGCITLKGISDPPAGDGVYFSSDRVDVIAHVYERHSAHIAARQICRYCAANTACSTRYNSYFSCDFHENSVICGVAAF